MSDVAPLPPSENPPESDPTSLTTQALIREVTHLRELVGAQMGALDQAAVARYEDFSSRLAELDRRYQQRYEAQGEAISAAFEAQQAATRTALVAAEKAVTTALESADKAVSKAESLNEKRFQLMNENTLVQSEMSDRIERAQERIEGLEKITDAKFVTYRTLIDSQAEKVALALAASDKAVNKAEVANEKRFEGLGELRGSLAEQTGTLMPRTEATTLANSLTARVDASVHNLEVALTDLKSRIDRQEGKSGGYASGAGALVAGIGVLATLITIVTAIILVVN